MILKYGSYAHQLAECSIAISKSKTYDANGAMSGLDETWTIDGRLEGVDRADLTTKITALEAAYSIDGQNLILFDSDGTTESAHKLISSQTIFGVQITELGYPDGKNAEYSTFRNYRIVAKAAFWLVIDGDGSGTTSWQQSIDYTGTGGPKFVVRPIINGNPIKQQIYPTTPVMAVQSGSAVGRLTFPTPPVPIYGADEQVDQRKIRRSTDLKGGKPTYTTTWTYQFLKALPF